MRAALLCAVTLTGCANHTSPADRLPSPVPAASVSPPPPTPAQRDTGPLEHPNLVLVILDDVGVERLAFSGEPHTSLPDTPFLDTLADQGMVFERAYASPTCSPTRYNLLTGRYGRRIGLGKPLAGEAWEVPLEELTLPQLLADQGYTSAVAGKWHLSTGNSDSVGFHPLDLGFDQHRGSLGNIPYSTWWRFEDGVAAPTNSYPTTHTTDDALALVRSLPEPWFVWTAYNAAHAPLHVPPTGLNPSGINNNATPTQKLHAMVEAFDIELERFMAEVDLTTTTVVFLGDNGTHHSHIPASWTPTGGKGSVFESGIRVPMFVVGPNVTPGRTPALVSAVDIFPTLLELAGVNTESLRTTAGQFDRQTDPAHEPWLDDWVASAPPHVIDGTSLVDALELPGAPTQRGYIYAERFLPLGSGPYTLDIQSIRSERYKLIRFNGVDSLFDLLDRHDDGPDLLLNPLDGQALIGYEKLKRALAAHQRAITP